MFSKSTNTFWKRVCAVIRTSYKTFIICDALRDLVPFAQFKKHEKHPCRSATFSKVAVAKSNTPL